MNNVILELIDCQREISEIRGGELSDSEFAKTYLPFSATTWSRLKSGKYGADTSGVLAQAEQALEEIPARIDALRKASKSASSFVRTSIARAALSSILAARDSGNRRVVPVLAPTGWGKTYLGEHLAGKGAIVVGGRQAWFASYRALCSDICAAVGPALPTTATEARAEAEMIRRLKNRGNAVLYLDEANAIGAGFANAVKLLHNETDVTIVIAAVPELWDRFVGRNVDEVKQVINRCQPMIRASRMASRDVIPFLADSGLDEKTVEAIAPDVADVANTLGGFKVVTSICKALKDIEKPTIDDARQIIELERRNIIAAGLPVAKKGGAA